MIELRRKANKISLLEATNDQERQEIELVQKYFLAIHTVMKIKSCYPLKPAGVILYRKLEKIASSLENTLKVFDSDYLRYFLTSIQKIAIFNQEVKDLEKIFNIIKKTASLITKSYSSEDDAKTTLYNYIHSLSVDQGSEFLFTWISYYKKVVPRWLPHLFRYISYPVLPNTNNDIERFNLKLKKLYRKISGRKNSHSYLISSGVPTSYVLSSDFNLSLSSILSFSHSEIVSQRNILFQTSKRSFVYSIKSSLEDFLFDLEIIASH